LSSLKNLLLYEFNPVNADVQAAAVEVKKQLGGKGLDILINIIGIGQEKLLPAEHTELHIFCGQFEVNVIGTQLVTLAFLPLLRAGSRKLLVNMLNTFSFSILTFLDLPLSVQSCITMDDIPGYPQHRDYAKDLASEGFTMVPLYPGVTSHNTIS